jgi:hypothetical protein
MSLSNSLPQSLSLSLTATHTYYTHFLTNKHTHTHSLSQSLSLSLILSHMCIQFSCSPLRGEEHAGLEKVPALVAFLSLLHEQSDDGEEQRYPGDLPEALTKRRHQKLLQIVELAGQTHR